MPIIFKKLLTFLFLKFHHPNTIISSKLYFNSCQECYVFMLKWPCLTKNNLFQLFIKRLIIIMTTFFESLALKAIGHNEIKIIRSCIKVYLNK